MIKVNRMWMKPGLHRKVCTYLLSFALLISPSVMSGQGKNKKTGGKNSEVTTGNVTDAARALVLAEDFDKAVTQYTLLLQKDSSNVALNAEYAYALALNGIYDAALARFDRIWDPGVNSPEVNFYASQVFSLMGYNQVADEFIKRYSESSVPGWIALKAADFVAKYRFEPMEPDIAEQDDVETRFKRANRLTAQNYNLQSIALFEEIIMQYPDQYLPYVGYSIALEKAGMNENAVKTIEKALEIAGDKPENEEARQLLKTRMETLKSKTGSSVSTTDKVNKMLTNLNSNSFKYTAYAGGMIAKSYMSLNGRFGTYKTGVGSTSVDLGITRANGSTALTLGLMTFFRQKIFVSGVGANLGFGGGAIGINLKVSAGVSLMNKERTASWDIFADALQPLIPKGGTTSVGMSIGRSVYFGKR